MINAEERLREQIAATVHAVDVDAYGCPVNDPVATDPGRRPADPVPAETLTEVTAISVCKYAVGRPGLAMPHPPLLSSLRLEGPAAASVVEAIAAAPEGGGPDAPDQCTPDHSYGDDVIVLRVSSARGESTVLARYSGCDHNGFDDGVTVRALTREAIQPLVAGPNLLSSWTGPRAKQQIVMPAHLIDR